MNARTVSPRLDYSTSSGCTQDADAFPPAQDLTAAEDAELHQRYLSRLEDERRAAACLAAFKPLADVAEAVRLKLASDAAGEAVEAAYVAIGKLLARLPEVADGTFTAEPARLASRPAGYRDAPCLACGAALYVPEGEGADVLCPGCALVEVA